MGYLCLYLPIYINPKPPRFRVLEGFLGETLTLGGEEWEGR
jgi:hypothetical protein